MPELPEVETIKRELQRHIAGKKICEICVHHPAVIRQPSEAVFKKGLRGATITRVLRRGKLLIMELAGGKALTVHLKMTGQLVYPGTGKGSRVTLRLSDGKQLDFNDQRLFGEMRLLEHWQGLKFVQKLGPEPFDLSGAEFSAMLAQKKTSIKPLLMDQGFIAGIGNLYAAEALFRARIHPQRPARTLNAGEKERLFRAIKDVLRQAIKYGGSSVDDYVRLSGKRGSFSRFHRVYGRQGKPCFNCKALIQRIAQGGRGTYFCPRCQR